AYAGVRRASALGKRVWQVAVERCGKKGGSVMGAVFARVKGQLTLVLTRISLPGGTNGTLLLRGAPICHTIELPWRGNRTNVSCIPAGRYRLRRTWSQRFGFTLRVMG